MSNVDVVKSLTLIALNVNPVKLDSSPLPLVIVNVVHQVSSPTVMVLASAISVVLVLKSISTRLTAYNVQLVHIPPTLVNAKTVH